MKPSQTRNQIGILSLVVLQACGAGGASNGGNPRFVADNTPITLSTNMLLGLPVVTFQLNLLGNVTPPTVGGNLLAANDVFVEGATAYISYNLAGNTQAGAIDQISNVLNLPLLAASATFTGSKINGLYKNGTSLFAVGSSSGATGPAFLSSFTVPSNLIPTTLTPTASTVLGSYAGVGIVQRGTSLYAISGDDVTNGGMRILNSTTLAQTSFTAIKDARGVSYSTLGTGDMYVVAAQPGRILDIDTNGVIQRTIALGGATIPESKSTITVGKTMMIASIGDGGAKVVCVADGHILASTIPPAGATNVTNAVSAGPGLLFVANGEAGVYVYQMQNSAATAGNACSTVTLTLLGSIALGSGFSANNVKYVGGILYVASGTGGFRMIAVVSTPTGTDNVDFI